MSPFLTDIEFNIIQIQIPMEFKRVAKQGNEEDNRKDLKPNPIFKCILKPQQLTILIQEWLDKLMVENWKSKKF